MKKTVYESPEISVILFGEDIITTSVYKVDGTYAPFDTVDEVGGTENTQLGQDGYNS